MLLIMFPLRMFVGVLLLCRCRNWGCAHEAYDRLARPHLNASHAVSFAKLIFGLLGNPWTFAPLAATAAMRRRGPRAFACL